MLLSVFHADISHSCHDAESNFMCCLYENCCVGLYKIKPYLTNPPQHCDYFPTPAEFRLLFFVFFWAASGLTYLFCRKSLTLTVVRRLFCRHPIPSCHETRYLPPANEHALAGGPTFQESQCRPVSFTTMKIDSRVRATVQRELWNKDHCHNHGKRISLHSAVPIVVVAGTGPPTLNTRPTCMKMNQAHWQLALQRTTHALITWLGYSSVPSYSWARLDDGTAPLLLIRT